MDINAKYILMDQYNIAGIVSLNKRILVWCHTQRDILMQPKDIIMKQMIGLFYDIKS